MTTTLAPLVLPNIDLSAEAHAPGEGPVRIGSEEHKRLFCRTLMETFNPFKPAVIDWPVLDEATKARVTGLPIWDIAVQTENRASVYIGAFAEGVNDPLLKKAVDLDSFEERRHRHVLSNLVEAYGIQLAPEPPYKKPKDPEWAFMVTGFSECIDSVFGFGLFETARRSGFFPPELVETFEPVMHEEARHILFFVNWVAWRRANMPLWRRPWFQLKVMAVWVFLGWERIGVAGDVTNGVQDNNFTMTGAEHMGVDLDIAELIDISLAENDRRLSVYDKRLVRPRFFPAVARFARFFMGPAKREEAAA